MRSDALLFIIGYVLGNPTARNFMIKVSDRLGKIAEEKIKEAKNALDRELKGKNHDTQIL